MIAFMASRHQEGKRASRNEDAFEEFVAAGSRIARRDFSQRRRD
jgi:hypothetical protein